MGSDKRILFDPFCLDLVNECLWRGSQAIKLRPKAFSVLNYLLELPCQLVTKEELLNAVWPGARSRQMQKGREACLARSTWDIKGEGLGHGAGQTVPGAILG